MNQSRTRLRLILATMCLSLLVVRVAGVHLHLCFDGSEPPLSYHVADSGIHHADGHEAGERHSDRDIPVAGDVVAKKPTHDQDATLLCVVLALVLFLLTPARKLRPDATHPPALRSFFTWLRPPLRGPPSPA